MLQEEYSGIQHPYMSEKCLYLGQVWMLIYHGLAMMLSLLGGTVDMVNTTSPAQCTVFPLLNVQILTSNGYHFFGEIFSSSNSQISNSLPW